MVTISLSKKVNGNVDECRLIFSINSGRAGSGYLAELLGLDRRVDSGHERHPTLFGAPLQLTKKVGLNATYGMRRRLKIPAIDRVLQRGRIYAETSHGFCKMFWDVVMDTYLSRGCRLDIVLLKRPPIWRVACSLYRRNWTEIHQHWLLEPDCALADLPVLTPPTSDHSQADRHVREMDQVIWYLHDTIHKAFEFRRRYAQHPLVRIHTVNLQDIQTLRGVVSLFRRMDLKLDQNLVDIDLVVGRVHNANPSSKNARIACTPTFVHNRLAAFRTLHHHHHHHHHQQQ